MVNVLILILNLALAGVGAQAVPGPTTNLPPETDSLCGAYQSEDYGDRVIYSLTDFRTTPLLPTYYSIQNPAVETGLSLVRGFCYCVKGYVRPDLEFAGDAAYKVIYLTEIVGPPTVGCWPN